MEKRLAEIVTFLNAEEVRATYTAVADVIGVLPISLGARLGDHSVEKSWIVGSNSPWLPTQYDERNIHPKLRESDVITTGAELRRRMALAARP